MNDKPITTIKYLCEFYGISQTELARKYDIPLRTVQQWHAGHRTPPPYVINMILELLHREHCEKQKREHCEKQKREIAEIVGRDTWAKVQDKIKSKSKKPTPPSIDTATYVRTQPETYKESDRGVYIPPLGYKTENGETVVDEEETEVVRRAAEEMVREGCLTDKTSEDMKRIFTKHYRAALDGKMRGKYVKK